MNGYKPRVVEAELHERMKVMGAMLIEGPKAVGKTKTASRLAQTVFRLDVDDAAIAALTTHPDSLFSRPTPILFDEWQEAPGLWNHVRRAVDDNPGKGLYLLTGSATPRDTSSMHSGAGRIGRIRMRPMSLSESGHSDGSVSLASILDGNSPQGSQSSLTIPELLERIVIGGWPEPSSWSEPDARMWLTDYLRNLAEVDIPSLGPRRNPQNIQRLLAALGRAVGTALNLSELEKEVGGSDRPISSETLHNYLSALERLLLIEPLPAWQPHMRSRTRLRTSPVHHFVDPSLGTAALGVSSQDLLNDLNAAGFHFESLALRDLRIYSQALGARLSSWRDSQSSNEVDAVLELPDSRWAAFEFKLGESSAEAGAESLLRFADKIDQNKHGKPSALVVVTGGRFVMRRKDGVLVVPLSQLGP